MREPATAGAGMAKSKGTALTRLQSAARLTRTSLAGRLLAYGFYAGQDQIMLALSLEDGQTPWGCMAPAVADRTIRS